MSKKLKYKIISCSSEQPQFPSSQLLFGGQNGGWQTKRFCTYPQQVTFQFYGAVKIQKIQIISDNRKVPSQVDILFYMPFQANGRQSEERFQKYGYLNFSRNQNSQLREQKSIMVDIKCVYLRFLIHKPHQSRENFFSQIGIHQISIYGNDLGSTFSPLQRMPRQMAQQGGYGGMGTNIDDDPFVVEKLGLLGIEKQRAVQREDFETANEYKLIMQEVRKAGEQLRKLNYEKRMAIEQQDYDKANKLKKSIQKHRRDLDELISLNYNESNLEQNEFVQYSQQQSRQEYGGNDFQDNEFVDPEMNQMIERSAVFSAKGQNSRVINNSNSRLVINKSLLKKQANNNKQRENYDDRVIPTLNNNSTTKSKQDQLQEIQNNSPKKIQLKLQQIDGKYLQYSNLMQDHFSEQTIKKFFSQHWQYKVEGLTGIIAETKQKQSPQPSFIKALIVVVKNSITETNFQVSLNSLQLFIDMLKLNAKANLLARNNQLNNDLDTIAKEIVKKISDNNNKIKQQAQKAFTEMVTSSLYGPQVCTNLLTKTKQKVKLSSKQLISRLNQAKKIVEKHASNNQQIVNLATDFAIDNVKNPSAEVRNQALNLLTTCRDNDSSGSVEKKISDKNLSEMIESYESKGAEKPSKGKKLK